MRGGSQPCVQLSAFYRLKYEGGDQGLAHISGKWPKAKLPVQLNMNLRKFFIGYVAFDKRESEATLFYGKRGKIWQNLTETLKCGVWGVCPPKKRLDLFKA